MRIKIMYIKKFILDISISLVSLNIAMFPTFSLDTLSTDCSQTQSIERPLNPYERPDDLQKTINATYTSLLSFPPQWNYNGSSSYGIMSIDCADMLKSLIKVSSNQKQFYVLDIGAGNFSWGNRTVDFINEQSDLPEDIIVHVISVTGENYGGQSVEKIGKCKRYNIDAFKIEDLYKGLTQLMGQFDLNLLNNFDFIVSSYTFIHLHDPVGTFVQAYNFLRPEGGIILFHGFPVYYGPKEHYILDYPMIEFLLSTKVPFLVGHADGRDILPFLMKRPNRKPLSLSLEYAGTHFVQVANTSRKPVAYFNQLEKIEVPPLNLPTWLTGAIHGDRHLFEWVWANSPQWQIKRVVWQPLLGSEEEGKLNQIEKLPAPLFHAVNTNDQNKLINLFAEGADVNQRNAMGIPLIFTTYNKSMQIFLLNQKGFDPNTININGSYVIHHLEGKALHHLIHMKPKLDAQDRFGDTALHKAIRDAKYSKRRLEDIGLLLNNGANSTIRNLKGETPFDLIEARIEATAQIISEFTRFQERKENNN